MSEKYDRKLIPINQHIGYILLVPHRLFKKVALSRKPESPLVRQPVRAVIVACDDIAAGIEITGKIVVTRYVLGHSVHKLNYRFGTGNVVP